MTMPQAVSKPLSLDAQRAAAGRDLLAIPVLRALLRSRWYPGILQWPTLAVFVIIIWQLLLGPASAHDNLGTALTWVLWWPLIPIIFLLLGRFWCAICPFAAVSDLVQRFVGNHRPVPRFLRRYGIWIIDAIFILITWSDHVFGIVESPWGSGMLLLLLTSAVVVSGAFWERRTWCRYLCFLGGLAGNYARTGMLALRPTAEKCSRCTVAACYRGSGCVAGCPVFEFPKTMTSNALCNVCANCIKTCPNDSPRLTLRLPTSELWFVRKPRLEEAFLAVVIMGIVFVQNVTMLDMWKSILAGLERLVGTSNYAVNFTITFLVAMALPVLLLGGAALIARRFNHDSLLDNFTKFGYAIIPLDVAGHVAHNLFHLLAEGKSILYTALALLGSPVAGLSPALASPGLIQALQYGLLALGLAASLYAAHRIARQHFVPGHQHWGSVAIYGALLVLLGAINFWLFASPMAMRM